MANIGFADEELAFEYDSREPNLSFLRAQAWPLPMEQAQDASQGINMSRPMERIPTNHQMPYQQQSIPEQPSMSEQQMMNNWAYQQQSSQYSYPQQPQSNVSYNNVYAVTLPTSPINIMPTSQPPMNATIPLNPYYLQSHQPLEQYPFNWHDVQANLAAAADPALSMQCQAAQSSSPSDTHLEVRSLTSLSDSEGWSTIEHRHSHERNVCVDPSETVHHRTSSESSWTSDFEHQAQSLGGSFEMVGATIHSPSTDSNPDFDPRAAPLIPYESARPSLQVSPIALARPVPVPIRRPPSKATSPTRSPTSQCSTSPTVRRPVKKSPIAKATEKVIKKAPQTGKSETEKKVGKRKGPLRPEQRKQAGEIRKLRACLRCRFLKKTCDVGEPCTGCQPAHARLWQVPCTRIDIKEIGFFTKDYRADYTRHLTFELSAGNIKGFSDNHKKLFISHGYGHMLPLTVREVYVRDEKMFDIDWAETNNYSLDPKTYVARTAPLYADLDCLSPATMSDYLDRHLDVPGSFHSFIDSYCGETPFLTSMLKTAFDYYNRTKAPVIRKALKFLLAYSLTLHITLVEGVPDEESFPGRVDDETSLYHGKIVAPNAINFQVKTSMGTMWRDLQKEVLEELSSLYSSVYSGDKLKHWPTIFILATLLLAVWEFMQFDAHRVPNDALMEKFLNDMETVPVGVVVGLFQAISVKLPSFVEWDTTKHHQVLQSNDAACKTMSEVRDNVMRYGKHALPFPPCVKMLIRPETYLRSRSMSAKYDPEDFDSLSNKLISKLVIRAN